MIRGERLIKLGDSWFSPKDIEVSPCEFLRGGRALDGLGVRKSYQIQLNSEYHVKYHRRQTVGAKIHGREGNSPDRRLRSQNIS